LRVGSIETVFWGLQSHNPSLFISLNYYSITWVTVYFAINAPPYYAYFLCVICGKGIVLY